MISRCTDLHDKNWSNYGGRGILVCTQWLADFDAFCDDMGPHPGKGYTLERRDNDGNYEPGNCKWATRAEQNNNRRRRRPSASTENILALAQQGATDGEIGQAVGIRARSVWAIRKRWKGRV
jgi:hypothetical protein